MSISARLAEVRDSIEAACLRSGRLPGDVELLAVSKTRPAQAVRDARAAGHELFGENKVQELMAKSAELEGCGVRWHLIGSLQTNKAKALVRIPGLELLHSLDRVKLADALEKVFGEAGRELPVLLQINATGEPDKHGVEPAAAPGLLRHLLQECPHLKPRGVMAMGPLEGDPTPVFERVAELRQRLETESGSMLPILSLGMTSDLEAAVAAGSNLVRVGTAIFGSRG